MDPISIAMGVAQFAPSVLRWITGSDKAEQAAQAVVGIAQQVTGTSSGAEALAALNVSPDKQIELRKALAEQAAQLDLAYLADRADARKRDVALIQAGHTNTRANVLIALAFLGVVAVAVLLALGVVSASSSVGGFLIAVGTLFANKIGTAFDFEFGSSRSSQAKDATIANLTRGDG